MAVRLGCLGYLALEEHAVGTPCARQGAELKPGGRWLAAWPPAGVDTFLVRFRVPLRVLALECLGLKRRGLRDEACTKAGTTRC